MEAAPNRQGGDTVLASDQFSGGPAVPFSYTIREQLKQLGDSTGTTYPFSAKYTYLANGTVGTSEFYSAGSPAAQKRYRYQYPTYDALNRLKAADYSGWTGSAWATTLAYDLTGINYELNGNLTGLQRYKETAGLVDNLTYTIAGTSNRLTSLADAVGVTADTWDAEAGAFTYDANGNQLTAPGPYSLTASVYDPRNLPLSFTKGGVSTAYRYDDGGQRITKQVGAGNTEVYLRDGSTTLGVFTVNAGGTVTSSFFNLHAGDRIIGRQPSVGSRVYYHTDLLGTTRAVVQGATVVESYDYDPWGVVLSGRSLGSGTKEGFTSKERDAETGLDYFGARHYMAALGRWSSVDPAAAADKQPEWSPFVYVGNDPVRRVDPDGRCPIPQVCVAAAVIGGSALAAAATQAFTNYQQNRPLTEGVGRAALEGATAGATAVLVGLGIEVAVAGVVAGVGAVSAARAATAVTEGAGVTARGTPGTYRPNRSLPRDQHGRPVPDTEAPHTQLGQRTSKRTGETYTQAREFDAQGRPVRDIDFTTHGRGDHGNPHQHRYDPVTGKRLSKEPLR